MIGKNFTTGLKGLILLFLLSAIIILTYQLSVSSSHKHFFNKELLESELFNDHSVMKLRCKITAYCPKACCNSGVFVKRGRRIYIDWSNRIAIADMSISQLHSTGIDIVAIDPSVIPFGSIVYYKGTYYLAMDTGGAIKGKCIDLSMKTHEATHVFGKKTNQRVIVYKPQNPRAVVEHVKSLFK